MFTQRTSSVKIVFSLLGVLCLPLTSAQASETVLHSFSSSYLSGAYPVGQLAVYGGAFYGMTTHGLNGYGNIFKMSSKGVITILHEFNGADGASPYSGMTQINGTLYGAIPYGGSSDLGVLFRIGTNGAGYTVLHTFTGYIAGNPAASDGSNPYGELLLASDGNLYGTTSQGGSYDQGTVFMFNPSTGSYSVIHSFNATTDTASHPASALADGPDGYLYGTSNNATNFDRGLYKLKKDGTGYAFVHGFTGSDPAGNSAYFGLIKANDGNLYGVSSQGGANGLGTVYKLAPSTGSVTPLWAFEGYTGAFPIWKVIQGTDGNLYGVTDGEGYYGYGTAFKLSLAGACSVLTDFNVNNTSGTANPLLQYGSNFYCISTYGGQFTLPGGSFFGYGAALSISSTGAIKLLTSFFQRDGWNAYAPLVQAGSSFYGETYYGGEYGYGLLYKTDASGHYTDFTTITIARAIGKEPDPMAACFWAETAASMA